MRLVFANGPCLDRSMVFVGQWSCVFVILSSRHCLSEYLWGAFMVFGGRRRCVLIAWRWRSMVLVSHLCYADYHAEGEVVLGETKAVLSCAGK